MCSCCYDIRGRWRERNVYVESDEFETPHKKRGKGKKVCKRSKDGQHDWSGRESRMVWSRWTEWVRDETIPNHLKTVERRGYKEKQIVVCAKCSKPQSYMWRYSF